MQFATIFNIMFGILILHERFTKIEAVGLLAAVLGVFILAYREMSVEILGTFILITASFLVGLTGLLSKVYLRKINPLSMAGGTPIFVLIFISAYSPSTWKGEHYYFSTNYFVRSPRFSNRSSSQFYFVIQSSRNL